MPARGSPARGHSKGPALAGRCRSTCPPLASGLPRCAPESRQAAPGQLRSRSECPDLHRRCPKASWPRPPEAAIAVSAGMSRRNRLSAPIQTDPPPGSHGKRVKEARSGGVALAPAKAALPPGLPPKAEPLESVHLVWVREGRCETGLGCGITLTIAGVTPAAQAGLATPLPHPNQRAGSKGSALGGDPRGRAPGLATS